MKNKLVYSVGINDADYRVVERITVGYEDGKQKQKLAWMCPFYQRWVNMLKRCYSEMYHKRHPSYKNCYVCQEWLTFSNFKRWVEKENWKDKHLDKDILFPGNKVYSPETCVFVDAKVNTFLTECNASRGKYMIGVHWNKREKKFQALCSDVLKRKHLGYFDTELEAHKAWLEFKLKLACQLASEQSDPRIAKALIERYTNYKSGG